MFKKAIVLILLILTVVGCTTTNKESEKVAENKSNAEMEADWQESTIFQSNGFSMIGKEGRLGFIYDDAVKFYPNKENKYMWHFWGAEEELQGELKVVGIHEDSGERVNVLEGHSLAGPNNGADQHVPSIMLLPKSGMWELEAYIGE